MGRRLGVKHFPDRCTVSDGNGFSLSVPVATQAVFITAYSQAETIIENGWSDNLPRAVFENVAIRSAELCPIHQALHKDHPLHNARLSVLHIRTFMGEMPEHWQMQSVSH